MHGGTGALGSRTGRAQVARGASPDALSLTAQTPAKISGQRILARRSPRPPRSSGNPQDSVQRNRSVDLWAKHGQCRAPHRAARQCPRGGRSMWRGADRRRLQRGSGRLRIPDHPLPGVGGVLAPAMRDGVDDPSQPHVSRSGSGLGSGARRTGCGSAVRSSMVVFPISDPMTLRARQPACKTATPEWSTSKPFARPFRCRNSPRP